MSSGSYRRVSMKVLSPRRVCPCRWGPSPKANKQISTWMPIRLRIDNNYNSVFAPGYLGSNFPK